MELEGCSGYWIPRFAMAGNTPPTAGLVRGISLVRRGEEKRGIFVVKGEWTKDDLSQVTRYNLFLAWS